MKYLHLKMFGLSKSCYKQIMEYKSLVSLAIDKILLLLLLSNCLIEIKQHISCL